MWSSLASSNKAWQRGYVCQGAYYKWSILGKFMSRSYRWMFRQWARLRFARFFAIKQASSIFTFLMFLKDVQLISGRNSSEAFAIVANSLIMAFFVLCPFQAPSNVHINYANHVHCALLGIIFCHWRTLFQYECFKFALLALTSFMILFWRAPFTKLFILSQSSSPLLLQFASQSSPSSQQRH